MQELNILVSADHNYIPQLRAMLRSLFVNNQDCKITVYLLHSGLPEMDLQFLDREASRFDCEFISLVVNAEQQESSPSTEVFPQEAFYRLFAADYLPKTLKRILYLDCDISINGSLLDLYNTPISITGTDGQLQHYLFAGALDRMEFLPNYFTTVLEVKERLEMSDSERYVNAGVLLVNLEFLRGDITTDEIREIIIKFKDILLWNDQDLINMVFKKHILYVDWFQYNFIPSIPNSRMEIVRDDPVIIHFYGDNKPWRKDYPQNTNVLVQAKRLYEKYAAEDF